MVANLALQKKIKQELREEDEKWNAENSMSESSRDQIQWKITPVIWITSPST